MDSLDPGECGIGANRTDDHTGEDILPVRTAIDAGGIDPKEKRGHHKDHAADNGNARMRDESRIQTGSQPSTSRITPTSKRGRV